MRNAATFRQSALEVLADTLPTNRIDLRELVRYHRLLLNKML